MVIRKKIIEFTREIFTDMVMMDISVTDNQLTEISHLENSISGVIGLAGKYKGVLAIHIPVSLACAITTNFLGMDVREINEDVEDAVGELANMLGGNVKTILAENGNDIALSLPTTISGKEYDFQTQKSVERILVQFAADNSEFIVELQLEKE